MARALSVDETGHQPASRDGDFVIVPHRPGPLITLDSVRSQRKRDDLDELIDELFPDIDERPGVFDAGLAVLGVGLLVWSWVGEAPGVLTVLGVVALLLGGILPVRAVWRRARQRREYRRRAAIVGKGLPIDVSSAQASALVGAYEELLDLCARSTTEGHAPAIAAAHAALLEVASLLTGRKPRSERERGYVDKRAVAVAELVSELRRLEAAHDLSSDPPTSRVDALVDARDELDAIAPLNAVSRLEELIAEARMQRRGRG